MIKDQWYAVLESKEIKKKPVGITRLNEKLILWRDDQGVVHCIYDQCCHRGASLSIGKLVHNEIECPFHGFRYDATGKVTLIPANGRHSKVPEHFRVHSYLVKEVYGFVWLWYSDNPKAAPSIDFFEDLKSGFTYSSFSEVWNVHYTRAVENQLDVVHLPFVHASTIGKGNRTLVNGPVVKWNDNLMTFYVDNIVDDGKTIPLIPAQIKDYKSLFSLQLLMPNVWQNRISDTVRIVAAFVPIDEGHTRIYLRFYQKFANVPIARYIVGKFSNYFNGVILHQDRHVVLTQLPKKTELRMGENLIQGDLPIIEFRKKRAELKKKAAEKSEKA